MSEGKKVILRVDTGNGIEHVVVHPKGRIFVLKDGLLIASWKTWKDLPIPPEHKNYPYGTALALPGKWKVASWIVGKPVARFMRRNSLGKSYISPNIAPKISVSWLQSIVWRWLIK